MVIDHLPCSTLDLAKYRRLRLGEILAIRDRTELDGESVVAVFLRHSAHARALGLALERALIFDRPPR